MNLTPADLQDLLRRTELSVQRGYTIARGDYYAQELGGSDGSPAALLELCRAAVPSEEPSEGAVDGTQRTRTHRNADGTLRNVDGIHRDRAQRNPDGTLANVDGNLTNIDGSHRIGKSQTNIDGSQKTAGIQMNTDGTQRNVDGTQRTGGLQTNVDGQKNADGTQRNADGSERHDETTPSPVDRAAVQASQVVERGDHRSQEFGRSNRLGRRPSPDAPEMLGSPPDTSSLVEEVDMKTESEEPEPETHRAPSLTVQGTQVTHHTDNGQNHGRAKRFGEVSAPSSLDEIPGSRPDASLPVVNPELSAPSSLDEIPGERSPTIAEAEVMADKLHGTLTEIVNTGALDAAAHVSEEETADDEAEHYESWSKKKLLFAAHEKHLVVSHQMTKAEIITLLRGS